MVQLQEKIEAALMLSSYFETVGFKNAIWEFNYRIEVFDIRKYINVLNTMVQHFNILGMINGLGASSFVTIQEELEKITISKIGFLPTLKDIHDKFNKNLICCTYNITLNRTEYISYENNPDLPCIIALKMSSNLPLIFENFLYNGNLYIDGGIGDNFPIDIGDKIGKKILGIIINNNIEIFNNGSSDIDIIEYIYYLFFIPSMQSIEYKINRVSKKNAFITVDAFSNEKEKKKISMWNLTAKSIFHVDEWINLFKNAGYEGDYYWFKVN